MKLSGIRLMLLGLWLSAWGANAQSWITLRIMAANTTSGSNQRYETPGLNIFKGLKPDIVCVQEFNYASTHGLGTNTPAAIREMMDSTFGTNFSYFRETKAGYTIPNGIISRYPIVASGSWDDGDNNINDRGFAWAQIDLPGTNDLFAVSLHLKASSGSANEIRRFNQSAVLKALILSNFPANAWIVVGGDCNTYSQAEACLTNFGSFLSDLPAPADQQGGTNTNAGRTERYDRVMPSHSLASTQVPVVMGTRSFVNGLVFDSRVTPFLDGIAPVQPADSGASGMQHMGVVKDFRIFVSTTNPAAVPQPLLTMPAAGILRWSGVSNVIYSVQTNTNLLITNWQTLGTVSSPDTNFVFTNASDGTRVRYYRLRQP